MREASTLVLTSESMTPKATTGESSSRNSRIAEATKSQKVTFRVTRISSL